MKVLYLFIGILLGSAAVLAQSPGEIKGKILNHDGQPFELVNLSLAGTTLGSTTNSKGEYEIKSVPIGKYTLTVSFIGYETKSIDVKVEANQITYVPVITLNQDSKELSEVVVLDNRANRFNRLGSEYVAKIPLKNIENPQVYNTITSELLKEQVITNFDDALKNAPGVDKLWESTGRGGDGAGYFSLRGFAVQPTMLNGLPGLSNGGLDPANIERIEIIKGPSGALFGSSLISYGGLINVVTKKPYNH